MNIIVGATGQVGSRLMKEIRSNGFPVRAVVRNPEKLSDKNVETKVADLFRVEQLVEAFTGGTTAFLITPENPESNDIIGDTQQIVENYRQAILATKIKKVVALSSIGAHAAGNTGNLIMSRMLEQGLNNLNVEKIFIRPAYYFSNWLGYIETVKQAGILPTFFPEDLELEMIAPGDLALFIAQEITEPLTAADTRTYEAVGSRKYSSRAVAETFSRLLRKQVITQTIPAEKW